MDIVYKTERAGAERDMVNNWNVWSVHARVTDE